MRVCPKCKYRDLPVWRNAWKKRQTDVARLEDLEHWDSELAENIKKNPKFFSDGIFNYKLSKNNYVVRIAIFHCTSPGTAKELICELHHLPAVHPNQSKLLEAKP